MKETKKMTTTTTIYTLNWHAAQAADFAASRQSITITTMSLAQPSDAGSGSLRLYWLAMINAKKRGVKVSLILPRRGISPGAELTTRRAADYASKHGITSIFAKPTQLLHAKTALIDNSISWVGSANSTPSGLARNFEAWLRTDDPAVAKNLADFQGALQ